MNRLRTKAPAVVLSLASAFVLAGCLGESSTSGPSNGGNDFSAFLVFVSDRSGEENLIRVSEDGSGLLFITGSLGDDFEPDCSPDGSRIVFTSVNREGPEQDVYRLTSNGFLHRLTSREGDGEADYSPAWSPDGERIAFLTTGRSQFGGVANRVATMNTQGAVVQGVGDDLQAVDLDWSALGHGLAVASEGASADGDLDLLVTDLEGNVQAVSEDPSLSETHPAWSGADDRVAFTMMNADGTGGDIYSARADGSDLRQLTTHGAADVHPAFSPDGSQIAFASDRSGNFDIYVMDSDGGNLRQVTDDPAEDTRPDWCAL